MNKNIIAAIILSVGFSVGTLIFHNNETATTNEEVEATYGKKIGSAPKFFDIKDTKQKKMQFFRYLEPGINYENSLIIIDRNRLLKLEEKISSGLLDDSDTEYLQGISKKYNVSWSKPNKSLISQMLEKVDTIPVSLVLVQAANESAWGTSRFAREGNNYFGQWCFNKGCGLVPHSRDAGRTHEVAKFSSAQESIKSYLLNVNRNSAYAELRKIRANQRLMKQDISTQEAAISMMNGLLKYSERGQEYVNELQAMLRHNSGYF